MTSGLLVLAGLLLAAVGLVGLVRGRLGRGLRNRTTSALVAAVGLVVALAAGAVSPAVSDTLAAPQGATSGGTPAATPVRGSGPTTRPPTPSPTSTPRPRATPGATTTSPAVSPAPSGPSARPGTALAALAALPVKGRAPRTGYDRGLFGQAWADTDRNGCDTRNDILRRDLTALVLRAGTHGCLVLSGRLDDPYTGQSIAFVRGEDTSARVQIDHVVALSDAWQKGAQKWSTSTRTRFANDPLNLLAVDGPTNQAKSDGDAATWLPPRTPYRCAYVARQTAVKARYRLWVTAAERDAVRRVLTSCAAQRLPVVAATVPLGGGRSAPAAPRPVSTGTGAPPASAPAPRPAATAPDPRFASCAAAGEAGYGPYRSGVDPEYDWYRDRDHDGVVCER
jgi:hypothetical protein